MISVGIKSLFLFLLFFIGIIIACPWDARVYANFNSLVSLLVGVGERLCFI
jgi:hypothetical protein